MTPRSYQARVVGEARQAFAQCARAVLIVSPTGSGKTCIGSIIASGHLERASDNRVVWLAHRTELLGQAARALRGFGLDVSVRGENEAARVQVESVQTILSRGKSPDGTLLIADEAHHFAESNRCGDICKLYPRIVGLTATPERGDGKPLKPPFDVLLVAAQIRELIQARHLVPLHVRFPVPAVQKGEIAQSPADAYMSEANGSRALVFAPHLKAADQFQAEFRERGVACAIVSGKTPASTRVDLLAMHRRGDLAVLINCGVLTEGYDDPDLQTIIVARHISSQGLWLQIAGRGLRPGTRTLDDGSPVKTRCLLLDLVGNVHTLGRPDSDRLFALEGEAIKLTKAARFTIARLCRVCKAIIDDSGACFECGAVNGLVIPKVTDAQLFSWDDFYNDIKQNIKPRRDAIALAGMMRKYRHPDGRVNLGKCTNMYHHIFKRWPDPECVRQARELNHKTDTEYARAVAERDREADELRRLNAQAMAEDDARRAAGERASA